MDFTKIECPVCAGTRFNMREIVTLSRVTVVDSAAAKGSESYNDISETVLAEGWTCSGCAADPDEESSEILDEEYTDYDMESLFG